MQNTKISNRMRKNIILVLVIILLVALSQWVAVKMIYAHKIEGQTASLMASWYNLKAGSVEKDEEELKIYLSDYLVNKDFVDNFIDKQMEQASDGLSPNNPEQSISDQDIDEIVWQKIVKDAWLNNIAVKNELVVTQQELDEYINLVGGSDYLKDITENEYNLSFDDYVGLVVKPRVLEDKIYNFLLSNYQDKEAVARIQEAYTLLTMENGENWQSVAQQYSDDMTYVDNSLWLQEEDLVDFYEVIKYLEVGQVSKIVKVPTGYIIWKLQSLSSDGDQRSYEVRSIFVSAKTISDFFNDFLNEAKIKKIY